MPLTMRRRTCGASGEARGGGGLGALEKHEGGQDRGPARFGSYGRAAHDL